MDRNFPDNDHCELIHRHYIEPMRNLPSENTDTSRFSGALGERQKFSGDLQFQLCMPELHPNLLLCCPNAIAFSKILPLHKATLYFKETKVMLITGTLRFP